MFIFIQLILLGMDYCCFFLLYRCHNIHFLAYAAMFAGRWEESWKSVERIINVLPLEVL